MSIEIITPLDTALQQAEARAAELSASVESKQRQIEELRVELETLKQAISSDYQRISSTLIAEANERGWCEIYDRIIDELNRSLLAGRIDERTSDYEVEVEVTATVSTTTYVTVTARSREEAERMVSSDYDTYIDGTEILEETISCNGFDHIEMEIA